ncbi:MAG: ABC transporter ATP-binding protein [Janthinobacterium lividum]
MKRDALSVTLENCGKSFGRHRALAPVNLTIGAGETVVLLGPSGCGKTTTLRMIAGLETPDAGGRVLFGDDDVTRLPIERRQVGMVFQSYALFPNLTVRDNIGYGLRIRGMPRETIRARVDDLLALTELHAHGDKPIDALSGGQRQRVALARALAPQPRILLLDEPLTALDARLRDVLRTEMNALLRELGVTTVYVTHDQAEAMALGDRIVVMSAGRIEQTGTPRDVYFRPANRAVAQFVGTMNRLCGEVRDGEFVIDGRRLPLARDTGGGPRPAGAADATQAFFRPEDAILGAAGSGQLQGRIGSAVFLGDRTRLSVYAAGSTPLIIDVPGRASWEAGDDVGLTLRPDALLLLD